MLKSVKIENFRGFKSFDLQQLGRINLLVGENNGGKTSILEALHLLLSRANLTSLKEQMLARGELSISEEPQEEYSLDARNIFYNYSFSESAKPQISGEYGNDSVVEFSIVESTERFESSFLAKSFYVQTQVEEGKSVVSQRAVHEQPMPTTEEKAPYLHFIWRTPINSSKDTVDTIGIRLSTSYALDERQLREYAREINRSINGAYFIRSASLTSYAMVEIFNRVVLTPDEELVNKALQVIEPAVKRIASMGISLDRNRSPHSNFFVLRSDTNQRVPIGNMGEGMWRMLGLALGLVNAKGGILLVDDIDTGLHFSTMVGMWKMIWETAKRLDVQVFATTHSRDCWESLAEIARSEDAKEQGITIHRIEKGKERSIVFNERRIVIAADQEIEVR